jgi:hypothetical protein
MTMGESAGPSDLSAPSDAPVLPEPRSVGSNVTDDPPTRFCDQASGLFLLGYLLLGRHQEGQGHNAGTQYH